MKRHFEVKKQHEIQHGVSNDNILIRNKIKYETIFKSKTQLNMTPLNTRQ